MTLSIPVLSAIMLSVIMMNGIMLSVIMLSVVAPVVPGMPLTPRLEQPRDVALTNICRIEKGQTKEFLVTGKAQPVCMTSLRYL
jgi:ribose/xylose/arabinose/galactoside ABC-type transport system permease subunit